MKIPDRIEINPDIMLGKPCVRGTRIPVYLLLEKMAAGETQEELLKSYPQLFTEDLQAVLEYAALLAREELSLSGE